MRVRQELEEWREGVEVKGRESGLEAKWKE